MTAMTLEIKENISLAPYTIYKIGGPARYFVEARNVDELHEAMRYSAEKRTPFFVLGAGSNVLVSDKGFDGLVIRMTGGAVRIDGERLIADAGVMMARAAFEAARHGLAGFEWAIGVPGTIGGSVRGNAGCFGGEMKDIIESVQVLDTGRSDFMRKSDLLTLKNSECEFLYRDSIFKRHPEWMITSAVLKLKKGAPAAVQDDVRRITMERSAKQDIGTKSCGCIFKNVSWPAAADRVALLGRHPELARFSGRATIPASFLIDAVGMKGSRHGRAIISEKHANFFVNEGDAAASDIARLAAAAGEAVMKKYGLALEEEIQRVGF